MKLSIVIICWNDREYLETCLESIFNHRCSAPFEVIVTDNQSTDGSVAMVRARFPQVRLVQNPRNLGFGGGNNAGFRVAEGEYVLILNPDTRVRPDALNRLIHFADRHPEAGAFGCRVLNPDGSYQPSAYPVPTVRSYLIAALYLRWLGWISDWFLADTYVRWRGSTEREIGFQAGCCLMVRRRLLNDLGGFDERLFHQTEDADLCLRVWESGSSVLYFPEAEVVHVRGQNRGTYPIAVVLETQRSRYRLFYKHYGRTGAVWFRWISLLSLALRWCGYFPRSIVNHSPGLKGRLALYRVMLAWHWRLRPVQFIQSGREPEVGYAPLAPAPDMGRGQSRSLKQPSPSRRKAP